MTSLPWLQIALIILPVILPPLISLSVVLYQHLLQRLPRQKHDVVEQIVRTVVSAVEQMSANVACSADKKKAAIDLATRMLASIHIQVAQETLSALIEATVYAMNQAKQATAGSERVPSPGMAPTPVASNT